ncbi:hypothetical protein [Acinetobacter rathckeae]|uniref:hypothetical protein n=1 Tax=Acinetobacter rathckeae TaxID=2605272 RepID=UPI0018A25342|nr:hypothetical protein [Acinetobacter rathckeae]MBF7696620.1 hypothetical protein [Acinetobacter rathckeae]
MNDFFIASDKCYPIYLGEHEYSIQQIKMKDFAEWIAVAEPIKQHLKTIDNDYMRLLVDLHDDCMGLIALVSDIPIDIVHRYVFEDISQIGAILGCIIDVNGAYFKEQECLSKNNENFGRIKASKKENNTWFDSFQCLVQAGHSHESIMNMNYGTFYKYIEAVEKQNTQQFMTNISAMRIAYHADAKGYQSFKNNMDRCL